MPEEKLRLAQYELVDKEDYARFVKVLVEESSQLTRIVLERGWADSSPPMEELLKVMMEDLDLKALQDLCDRIVKKGNSGTAILLIPYLMEKSPQLAAMLAKSFINAMPVELVIKVARVVAEKRLKKGLPCAE